MQLLDALKMGTEQTQRRIDLNLKWAAAAFYTADDQQLKALQTSLELAEALNDNTRIVKTTNALGRIHYSKGNFAVSGAKFERSIELAQAIEDQELLALPYNIVGRTCAFTGEYQKGIEYLRKGIPMMERQGNDGETAWSKSMLAVILGWVGDLKEAIPLNQDAVALSRKAGNLTSESAALCRFCAALVLHGRFQDAIRAYSQALEISRQIGNQIVTGLTTSLQGFARFLSVPDREGISMMEKGIKLVESTGSHMALSFHYAWLAEAHALAGDTRRGLAAGERSLEILQFGERWGEVIARRALAMVEAGTTDPDWGVVDEHMQASLRLARERGERPNLALAHLRHAEILHKKVDLARARVEIDQASKLFLDMDMTWWGEQAEALRGRIERGEPFRGYAPQRV
jgi:tetratricopeptide (TPR) repeat protein